MRVGVKLTEDDLDGIRRLLGVKRLTRDAVVEFLRSQIDHATGQAYLKRLGKLWAVEYAAPDEDAVVKLYRHEFFPGIVDWDDMRSRERPDLVFNDTGRLYVTGGRYAVDVDRGIVDSGE